MLNRKTSFCALLFIALMSCTKQDVTPSTSDSRTLQSNQTQTDFGILDAQQASDPQTAINNTEAKMNGAGIKLVRLPVFLSQTSIGRTVNQYLQDGYNVTINLNWSPTNFGPVPYPTDLTKVREQAEAFFSYYQQFRSQIPYVVVENEWDNPNYHVGSLQDYFNELSVIVDVAHKYGFKVSDAGITSAGLQRWVYSQLPADQAYQWKMKYYVGLHNNYSTLVNTVNSYIAGISKINLDCINVHWYNSYTCGGGFAQATQIYMQACNKNGVICNEFGIRTSSTDLFNATVDEINYNAKIGIAYSAASNIQGKAIVLTPAMLDAL